MIERILRTIDPKRELFRWGPLVVKQFYIGRPLQCIFVDVAQHYSWPWSPGLGIFFRGKMLWLHDYAALRAVGKKYFVTYFLNRRRYQAHWKRWSEWLRRYRALDRRTRTVNLARCSNDKVRNLLHTFLELDHDFWLIVHVPEVATWGGEELLRKRLEKIDRDRTEEHLEILSAPIRPSFFQEEERTLLKIGLQSRSKWGKALERHARAYHWILNSYGSNRVLTPSFFRAKLLGLLRHGSAAQHLHRMQQQQNDVRNRKRAFLRSLHLSASDQRIVHELSQAIWWQDLRKSYIWRLHGWWNIFLHETARRTGRRFEDLEWCWAHEVMTLLGGKPVDWKKIHSRKMKYVFYVKNGKEQEFYGASATRIIKRYWEASHRVQGNRVGGMVVSRGKQQRFAGRVVVITDPFREVKKMREGSILVAPMTTPEYVVVMKKAKAIVTDHGGMTSHAAVVSRELGIPCIVNTKVATRVFKDGDRVEVDTEKGIVKKV